MSSELPINSDGSDRGPRRRPARIAAVGAITASLSGALIASGGLGYAAAAFGKPAGTGPAAHQYGGTRPGWGCGDRNHIHTGPPGRQYAPPPPGCTR